MTYDLGARRPFLAAIGVALLISQAACSLGASGLPPAPAEPCGQGSTIEFKDDFNDNMPGSQWVRSSGANIMMIERQLELQISSAGTPRSWGSYSWALTTLGTRSLIGCHVFIEVPQVLSDADPASVYLTLSGTGMDEELTFMQTGSKLLLVGNFGKAPPHNAELKYDQGAHRWWRIRELGGVVHWDTSMDGRIWSEGTSAPTPPFAGSVVVSFGAGSNEGFPNAGTAVFDNLNVPPP